MKALTTLLDPRGPSDMARCISPARLPAKGPPNRYAALLRLCDAAQRPMALGFIALLFLTSASALALWLGRGTPALALLLCLHLSAVMAVLATLPYGKFAHGIFRTAALLRHATEKRLPGPIGTGDE